SVPVWPLTPRSTSAEPTICGIAFGETKAPTSIGFSPAPISASMKAMRSATLTGVFSFCRPSRGPTSTMRTVSVMVGCRLDFGEFDALADDVADLAFQLLQHAGKRRAQGLLHLHDLEGEDRRTLLELGALLRQQGDDRAGQGRHDLVFADLLLGLAAERIHPMQVEAPVAGAQIDLVAFNHGRDARLHAVERDVEATIGWRERQRNLVFADRQGRHAAAIVQRDLVLAALPL